MVLHNGTILLCGGLDGREDNDLHCLEFTNRSWKKHSTLNMLRGGHSTVSVQKGTFIFGGGHSPETYEYLPKESTTWIMGKKEIPEDIWHQGCAIAVKSEQEIWLIGVGQSRKKIISFDVNDHTFKELPWQVNVRRGGFRCAFIPNTNKIMITGGSGRFGIMKSTEIIDTEDGSVKMASPMNHERFDHGMGVFKINNEDRLAVFLGKKSDDEMNDNRLELYNAQTEKWEETDIEMNGPKCGFGFLSVKLADIVSNL